MCKLCNDSDPSWVRKSNFGTPTSKAIEEACNIIVQYTGMYPCKKARSLVGNALRSNVNKSIDDIIINKLLRSHDVNNKRYTMINDKISRVGYNKTYQDKTLITTSSSKMIQQVLNRNTKHKVFKLRIKRKNLKVTKQFDTLSEAISYRDNILNSI